LYRPLPHAVSPSSSLRKFLHPDVKSFTQQTLPTVNRKHFFMNILYTESFSPQKRTTKSVLLWYYPQAPSPIWLLKPDSEHVNARLLPRLSWSWTVLLPSDTHREALTSVTVFYFHLKPNYWLSLVYSCVRKNVP
jgi:hypothetical protein